MMYYRRDECLVLRVLRSEELALPGDVVSILLLMLSEWRNDLLELV
jgi:hypothetical protein